METTSLDIALPRSGIPHLLQQNLAIARPATLKGMPLQPHLKHLIEGRATLSREDARDLMHQILSGQLTDIEIAALLGALAARGETPAEIAGFVETMRAAATTFPLEPAERELLVDTCGTGGDAS